MAYRCERELRDGLEDGMIPQRESGKCAEAELEAWGERMPQRERGNRAEAEQEDGESGWCRGKVENVQGRTEIGGKRCI